MNNYIEGKSVLASAKRILVVSNEPWADYHSAPIASFYKSIPVIHVIPDNAMPSHIGYTSSERSIPISCIKEDPNDVLLITGSGEWPLEVRRCFPEMKAIAIRLAYLTPKVLEQNLSISVFWAATEKHSFEIADNFSIAQDQISIEPYPWTSALPVWLPETTEILLVSSVTNDDIDGGSAGDANSVLLKIAKSLRENSIDFRISLHPRENPNNWVGFNLASGDTLMSASKASYVIAVTGTVVEAIYQMGVPLALIPVPRAPAYLYEYGKVITEADNVLEFISSKGSTP